MAEATGGKRQAPRAVTLHHGDGRERTVGHAVIVAGWASNIVVRNLLHAVAQSNSLEMFQEVYKCMKNESEEMPTSPTRPTKTTRTSSIRRSDFDVRGQVASAKSEGIADPKIDGLVEPKSEGLAEPGSEGLADPKTKGLVDPEPTEAAGKVISEQMGMIQKKQLLEAKVPVADLSYMADVDDFSPCKFCDNGIRQRVLNHYDRRLGLRPRVEKEDARDRYASFLSTLARLVSTLGCLSSVAGRLPELQPQVLSR